MSLLPAPGERARGLRGLISKGGNASHIPHKTLGLGLSLVLGEIGRSLEPLLKSECLLVNPPRLLCLHRLTVVQIILGHALIGVIEVAYGGEKGRELLVVDSTFAIDKRVFFVVRNAILAYLSQC